MREFWARNGPPVYRSVALYLGLVDDKPAAETGESWPPSQDDFEQYMAALAPGGVG